VRAGKSARLGEVHLHDVRQRDQLGGQGRGDDIVECDRAAGRLESVAAPENLRIRDVLEDLCHEEIPGICPAEPSDEGLAREVHEGRPAAGKRLCGEGEKGDVEDPGRRAVGVPDAESTRQSIAEEQLVGMGPPEAVENRLSRDADVHSVPLPIVGAEATYLELWVPRQGSRKGRNPSKNFTLTCPWSRLKR